MYRYVLVCNQYIQVYALFSLSGTAFLSFINSTSGYILTSSQYILGVPDSFVRLPGPAGLLASNSGSSPRIEPNQTKTGLFTTAW
jgi:hypothetical protein